MIKTKLIIVALLLSQFTFSQNFVPSNFSYPTCFGNCNGSVVFSTTTTTGPFTAVLNNSSSCPNTTVQSSTGNSITISGLCECASTYSINFYNSSSILVGFELLQVPITSTAPLVLNTPTVSPAVCSTCCDGSVHISWSDGYVPSNSTPTVTLDGNNISSSYFPNPTVCVGNHTVCVTDLANCTVCTTLTMNFVTHVGLKQNASLFDFVITPNPAQDRITISSELLNATNSLQFIDINGKIVLETLPNSESLKNYSIDISQLSAGVYVVEWENDKNIIFREKLIKMAQ